MPWVPEEVIRKHAVGTRRARAAELPTASVRPGLHRAQKAALRLVEPHQASTWPQLFTRDLQPDLRLIVIIDSCNIHKVLIDVFHCAHRAAQSNWSSPDVSNHSAQLKNKILCANPSVQTRDQHPVATNASLPSSSRGNRSMAPLAWHPHAVEQPVNQIGFD